MFAGLASGLLVFCFGTVMTLSTLHILASRSDYQHQYATSGAPDMNTFLVGDILTAVTAHLGINLILGLAGGGIGTLISRSRHTGPDNQPDGRPSRPVPPPAFPPQQRHPTQRAADIAAAGPPSSLLPHPGAGGAWPTGRGHGQRWRTGRVPDLPDAAWRAADGRVRRSPRPVLLREIRQFHRHHQG